MSTLLKAISDFPVIVQGALGSALFVSAFLVGKNSLLQLSIGRRHGRNVADDTF